MNIANQVEPYFSQVTCPKQPCLAACTCSLFTQGNPAVSCNTTFESCFDT